MKINVKTAALLTALSLMLTGCGSVSEEPVRETVPAAGAASEISKETAAALSQDQPSGTEAASMTTGKSTEASVQKNKTGTETEPPSGISDEVTMFYDIPDPEIEVSAEEFEEFEKEIGYSFYVPEGAQNVAYLIDTEQHRGTVCFYLGDVLWDAKVRRRDKSEYKPEPYVGDYETELGCEFESGQVTKLHGVEGDIRYYRIAYPDGTEAYRLTAEWFLEDEGFEVEMGCYSRQPIYTMPVEVLG